MFIRSFTLIFYRDFVSLHSHGDDQPIARAENFLFLLGEPNRVLATVEFAGLCRWKDFYSNRQFFLIQKFIYVTEFFES